MKSIILAILTFASFTCFAQAIRGTEISSLIDKKTGERIIFSIDKLSGYFNLEKDGEILELNSFKLKDEISIADDGIEHFRFTKFLFKASGSAYVWCFTPNDAMSDWAPAVLGAPILSPVTLPLCSILPAAPAISSLAVIPFEGAITLLDLMFDKNELAAQKFKKLIGGKSTKAGTRVFSLIKKRIIQL